MHLGVNLSMDLHEDIKKNMGTRRAECPRGSHAKQGCVLHAWFRIVKPAPGSKGYEKVKHRITMRSNYSIPSTEKKLKMVTQKLHLNVLSSIIHNSQEVETIQMSRTDERISKMWCFHTTGY